MSMTIAMAVFVGVLISGAGLYIVLSAHQHATKIFQHRLQQWVPVEAPTHHGPLTRQKRLSEVPWFHRFLSQFSQLNRLEQLRTQANSALPLGAWLLLSALFAIGPGYFFRGWVPLEPAVFVGVLISGAGLYIVLSAHQHATKIFQHRLQQWVPVEAPTHHGPLTRQKRLSEVPWFHRFLSQFSQLNRLEQLRTQANSALPLGAWLLLSALFAIGPGYFFRGWVPLEPWLFSLCCLPLSTVPFFYLAWCRTRRFYRFQVQLPDALSAMARSLRAGHGFLVGMKLVSEEFVEPLGPEFQKTVESIEKGQPITEAMKGLAKRVDMIDVKFFVTAIIVQREIGGNLTEILESLSLLIRQRFALFDKVRALSAEGRISGIILFAIPICLGLLMHYINPDYVNLLFEDPMGQIMFGLGSGLMVTGALITKRMLNIRV